MPSSRSTTIAKAKSGCLICRRRRVKCDEGKPECEKCLRSNRECSGYSHLFAQVSENAILRNGTRPSRHVSPARPIVNTFGAGESEWQAFDYSRHSTCSTLVGLLDGGLWHDQVLRHSFCDAAIHNAVVAVGHLSRHANRCNVVQMDRCSCADYKSAMVRYSAAITNLHNRQDPIGANRVPGIAFALFTCLESLLNNSDQILSLADAAMAILCQSSEMMDDALFEFFQRLKIYFYTVRRGHNSVAKLAAPPTPSHFRSLREARISLYAAIEGVITFVNLPVWLQGAHPYHDAELEDILFARQHALLLRLRRWREACNSLSQDDRATETFGILKSYAIMGELWITAIPHRNERAFANATDSFTAILDLASRHLPKQASQLQQTRLLNFELDWLTPLFYTATKCRITDARHRAISPMAHLPRQEGIWRRDRLLVLARRVAEREAAGQLLQVVTAAPEFAEDGVAKFKADYIEAAFDDNMPPKMFSEILNVKRWGVNSSQKHTGHSTDVSQNWLVLQ